MFDAMSLVHDREEDTATPSRVFKEYRKPTVTETHLWRRQDDPVVLFFHIL